MIPPPGKPTRHTNQLEFMLKEVLKPAMRHKHAWPFMKPVDAVRLGLPVRFLCDANLNSILTMAFF